MCRCAPFRELDIFSVDMLRRAMLTKIRSREGQLNRRLFCSIWDQSGLEPIGSGAEIHADEGVAHADLTDDGIVRSKHGEQQ